MKDSSILPLPGEGDEWSPRFGDMDDLSRVLNGGGGLVVSPKLADTMFGEPRAAESPWSAFAGITVTLSRMMPPNLLVAVPAGQDVTGEGAVWFRVADQDNNA